MSHILINSLNFFHNLNLICKRLGSVEKLMLVLKDNAYGHGLEEIAKLSSSFGVKMAAVRTTSEAKKIKRYFEYILVLSETTTFEASKNISYALNSVKSFAKMPKKCKVELKVDTGMHRNGVAANELERCFKLILEYDLQLAGIFTHFRSADELSSELFWQIKNYEDVKKRATHLLNRFGMKKPRFHSHNSAALFRQGGIDDDFARIGIAAYGYLESDEVFGKIELLPILGLWAHKVSTRVIEQGWRIGYGGVFESKKKIRVSTYDIGYADGFFRYDGLSELKTACKKKILGRISMDSLSCEGEENEICIFNDAKMIARHFDTICYDVLVKLSPNIKRIVV